eukprot:3641217-Amphidinium_carterae.1
MQASRQACKQADKQAGMQAAGWQAAGSREAGTWSPPGCASAQFAGGLGLTMISAGRQAGWQASRQASWQANRRQAGRRQAGCASAQLARVGRAHPAILVGSSPIGA